MLWQRIELIGKCQSSIRLAKSVRKLASHTASGYDGSTWYIDNGGRIINYLRAFCLWCCAWQNVNALSCRSDCGSSRMRMWGCGCLCCGRPPLFVDFSLRTLYFVVALITRNSDRVLPLSIVHSTKALPPLLTFSFAFPLLICSSFLVLFKLKIKSARRVSTVTHQNSISVHYLYTYLYVNLSYI